MAPIALCLLWVYGQHVGGHQFYWRPLMGPESCAEIASYAAAMNDSWNGAYFVAVPYDAACDGRRRLLRFSCGVGSHT